MGMGFDIGQLMVNNSIVHHIFFFGVLSYSLSFSIHYYCYYYILLHFNYLTVLSLTSFTFDSLPVPLGQCGRGVSKQLCSV